MTTRNFGLLFCAIGIILIVNLFFLYFWRTTPQTVDTQKLLDAIVQKDNQPYELTFPTLDYHKNLNEGLWGFERISRQNKRITEGKYTQLCQDSHKIMQQTRFWLNAPRTFMQQYPNSNYVTVRASHIDKNKIQHHFALENLKQTPAGLMLNRHEVQILWSQIEDQYELVIRQAHANFSTSYTKDPLGWLKKIRANLSEQPLIAQGHYNEQKMIAFRLENCNR